MNGHTLPGINQRSEEKVDLTKKPVGPVATKKTNDKGTLKLHLEKRGDAMGAPTAGQMENKGDFNISNLHKDTKANLSKPKKFVSDDDESAYENAQNDYDTDHPTKAQLAKSKKNLGK